MNNISSNTTQAINQLEEVVTPSIDYSASTDNSEGHTLWPTAAAGRKNLILLIQLRCIAVLGQIALIMIVRFLMGVNLPLAPMFIAPAVLIVVNIVSFLFLRWRTDVTNVELFIAQLFDIAALTLQLYLSGGVTNPFVALFLLQVVLGAVLLEIWSTWVIVGVTNLCFAFLTISYRPLELPLSYEQNLFFHYLQGSLICFALVSVLLVMFVTRISYNLRMLDARLAALRQHAAEEDLIVRMGLLASEAAHELGTPLSSLSVILGDWRRMPALSADPEMLEEIEEMQAEVQRCKSIVTGILLSAGEARGEAPSVTTMNTFLNELVSEWCVARSVTTLSYRNIFGTDIPIISDSALKKVVFNVLDNAFESSPTWVGFLAERKDTMLVIQISDVGSGFAPEILAKFGKPYQSNKGKPAGGLGLFLVVNVVRKLGGFVSARNRPEGGAIVTLNLPLAALAMGASGNVE